MDNTFPFGKFEGYNFYDVPINYIVWCIENIDKPLLVKKLKGHLIERLEIEIKVTRNYYLSSGLNISKIYKELSKKYHPDHGGNDEAMKAINEFYELLKNL